MTELPTQDTLLARWQERMRLKREAEEREEQEQLKREAEESIQRERVAVMDMIRRRGGAA